MPFLKNINIISFFYPIVTQKIRQKICRILWVLNSLDEFLGSFCAEFFGYEHNFFFYIFDCLLNDFNCNYNKFM